MTGKLDPKQADNSPAGLAASLLPINSLGFELWTVRGGVQFDNLLVTTNVSLAEEIGAAIWAAKYEQQVRERVRLNQSSVLMM